MSQNRVAPRYNGYLLVGIERADGTTSSGHLLELSRTGGLLASTVDLAVDERIAIHLNVDRAYELKYGVPDILRFEAVVVNPTQAELGTATQRSFRFPPDVLEQYWPWLDSIAMEHGMKPMPPTPPPVVASSPDDTQPAPQRRRGLFRRG